MRNGRPVPGLALATLVLLITPTIAQANGLLDGKTFVGVTREAAKEGDQTDEIAFQDGKLHSLACDSYGFEAGAYTAKSSDGSISFKAVTASPKEGTIEWDGAVIGDRLSGTYVWKKKGQKPIEYWVKATLKK